MDGSELTRILTDHARLRRGFDAIEREAKDIIDNWSDDIDLLVRAGESALCDLYDHIRWEDEHLVAALRNAGARGQDRAVRLVQEHREQRIVMRREFERLRDPTTPKCHASRNLLFYVESLRREMRDEENWLFEAGLGIDETIRVEVTTL